MRFSLALQAVSFLFRGIQMEYFSFLSTTGFCKEFAIAAWSRRGNNSVVIMGRY